MERTIYISGGKRIKLFPNLFAETGIFLVNRGL